MVQGDMNGTEGITFDECPLSSRGHGWVPLTLVITLLYLRSSAR